jgi:RNA polymerase sigma-70 factor (ECF subfamily)
MIENELLIIADVNAGHTEKFGLLYDGYFPKIYNYFFYRLKNKQASEDLTSITFIKAIKNINKFDAQKGDFSAWIYRIARNSLYDYYRTRKNTDQLIETKIKIEPEDLHKEVLDKEMAEHVQRFLNSLTETQRDMVIMRIWDDLSYQEISQIIGKSQSGSKMAFHRAIEKLKSIAAPFYAAK